MATNIIAVKRAWAESDVPVSPHSYGGEVWSRFLRNKVGLTALGVLGLLVLAVLCAPLLTPDSPTIGQAADRLKPIGASGHVLGTDEIGRDMLARLLYGGRLSLLAGFVPVVVATVIGTFLGALSGYAGGVVGAVIMRTLDMFYAFPAILLAIAIGASLGPGLKNAMVALTIVFIPPITRVAEAATRRVIVNEFIEAARLSGANTMRLVSSQVLVNIVNPIVVYASGLVGVSMIVAASLSFLGLGSKPPAPEWGYMLNSLRTSIYVNPWVSALPGLFIFITSVSFNTLSDALREALDIKRV
jgi:peptide/nickel transport system permease protein